MRAGVDLRRVDGDAALKTNALPARDARAEYDERHERQRRARDSHAERDRMRQVAGEQTVWC